jgi:hypothetical protein
MGKRELSDQELREQSAEELPNREEMAIINPAPGVTPTTDPGTDMPGLPDAPSIEPNGPPPPF